MKLSFRSYGNIQVGSADGIKTYEFNVGDRPDLPEEVAVLFLQLGVAEPIKSETASKPKGEKATK